MKSTFGEIPIVPTSFLRTFPYPIDRAPRNRKTASTDVFEEPTIIAIIYNLTSSRSCRIANGWLIAIIPSLGRVSTRWLLPIKPAFPTSCECRWRHRRKRIMPPLYWTVIVGSGKTIGSATFSCSGSYRSQPSMPALGNMATLCFAFEMFLSRIGLSSQRSVSNFPARVKMGGKGRR